MSCSSDAAKNDEDIYFQIFKICNVFIHYLNDSSSELFTVPDVLRDP